MSTTISQKTVPHIKYEWELLDLEDGSLLWDNMYGNHLRVPQPHPAIKKLLHLIDSQRSIDEIVQELQRQHLPLSQEQVCRVVQQFLEAGVLTEAPDQCIPSWLSPTMFARFQTEIEYFYKFATSETSAFDYFQRLRKARVAILGVGGNGSMAAVALAAAGVGSLRLIDGDVVETSNLVRQIFYQESQHHTTYKVDALAAYLADFTPYTQVEVVKAYCSSVEQGMSLFKDSDFLLLCADAPRFVLNRMVNQVCVQLAIPYLNAFYKRTGPMYVPGKSACFHCYEASLREEIGDLHDMIVNALQKNKQWHYPSIVFGPLQTGLLQAQECLAYLSGAWEPLSLGAVVFTDPDTSTRRLPIPIRQDCSVCSQSGAHTLQTKGGKEEDQ